MAHPLTQHPPNMIGFGAPATMSSLGFGFGQPSHSPAFGAHSPGGFGAAVGHRPGGMPGFGFGSATPHGSLLTSPLRRMPSARPSPGPMTPSNTNTLKRSRRPSQSPSSSPSPLASPSLSKRRAGDADEDLESDRRERRFAGKVMKRTRTTEQSTAAASIDGPDLGLLLASLPSTSHLPILLELLNDNPSLAQRVLRNIPQPPLANCIETLERIVYKIGKDAGSWEPQQGYVASRRWNRVENEVTNFTKTASTYIKFFTAPRDSSPEPNTIFHLLHTLTAHSLQILALVPADTPPSARPFLDLANLLLTNWTAWIGGLSDEVNRRGGMYAAGMVSTWADGLDSVARVPASSVSSAPVSTLASWASPVAMPTRAVSNALIDGFREALEPLRARFVNELGWLLR